MSTGYHALHPVSPIDSGATSDEQRGVATQVVVIESKGAEAPSSSAAPSAGRAAVAVASLDDGAVVEEEAIQAKPKRDLGQQTAAEREAHNTTHLPFRSWCADCVSGRLDNLAHTEVAGEDNNVPEVLIDYCFVRRQEEVEPLTVLLCKDRGPRALRAWALESKGIDKEEVVEIAAR